MAQTHVNTLVFFLNDVCQIVNLAQLLVMNNRLLFESVNAFFFSFVNEITIDIHITLTN